MHAHADKHIILSRHHNHNVVITARMQRAPPDLTVPVCSLLNLCSPLPPVATRGQQMSLEGFVMMSVHVHIFYAVV